MSRRFQPGPRKEPAPGAVGWHACDYCRRTILRGAEEERAVSGGAVVYLHAWLCAAAWGRRQAAKAKRQARIAAELQGRRV